ncbi:bifunctional DNA primase/polymerase [Neorhizobium alkalisoli]|uniref:AAA domain-containing protein n=1 Tax=Neorhizobium alkalisoli TaxID=528178 RepID=A0A561QH01_9HYPH|nr:bifunctional DNA primase/polymerase [Neorhizobium alkalisoli]TWF49636.1 AAA domain-containing protein [Neorhizobium alkalisoli]
MFPLPQTPPNSAPTAQQTAIAFAEQGWPCFPCRHEAEDVYDPHTGELEERGPKTPLTANGVHGAYKKPEVVERAWGRYPSAMIGLPTGSPTGFFVLDIDAKPGAANGFDWLAAMEAEHGPLPETARVTTPNGGMHVYFRHDDGVRNRGALGAGVDIRGEGGYVIGAGSAMGDGRRYDWADDVREIAEAPAWLLDLVKPKKIEAGSTYLPTAAGTYSAYVDAAVERELADLARAPMGNRNNSLNDAAFNLGQWVGGGHVSESDARAWLQDVARGWGRDWARCVKTIENGLKAGILSPRHPPEPDFQTDNTPPLDPEVVKRFVENSLRKQAERGMPTNQQTPTAANDNKAATLSIREWTVDRYVGEAPPVKWLVDGVIPLGVPGMVSAAGDTGKSFALLELHRRIAFGESLYSSPIFGGKVAVEGTSVMITSEDDANEVHRRVSALDAKGERFSELGKKMIVVPLPSAGGARAFWREDRKLGLVETDEFKRVCEQLADIDDLRLVTFDPLASFAHLPINEDPTAGQFVCSSLARLAAETEATILTAHHMRKSSKPIENLSDAREAIRGSTALVDGLRVVYSMWPADEAKAKAACKQIGVPWEPNRIVLGGIVKANGPARRILSTYARNEYGLLIDKTAGAGASAFDQGDLRGALVVAIAAAAEAGSPFTKTGVSGVYEMRERLPEELRRLARNKIETLAEQALERGEVVRAAGRGEKTAKWLDVPGGNFAIGLGYFTAGAPR